MQSWQKVWREGIAPLVSLEQLESLRTALATDDPRLIQGATTTPPPLAAVRDWPTEQADAIAYMGAMSMGGLHPSTSAATVGEVEEYFARICYEADRAIGEPAAIRYFLNWYDETPRDEMIRELLLEVSRSIAYIITEFREDTPIEIVIDKCIDLGREDLTSVLLPKLKQLTGESV